MRFNSLMATHFKGHPCVHEFPDPHRGRTLRVFNVDSTEVVGVSDGTDAWMVGVTTAIDGIPVSQLLERIPLRETKSAKNAPHRATRVRLAV